MKNKEIDDFYKKIITKRKDHDKNTLCSADTYWSRVDVIGNTINSINSLTLIKCGKNENA